jgi:hypothetical protein
MVERYCEDVYRLMSEMARVLKPDGKAILIVGNSCLKGQFIQNSRGVTRAGEMVGLRLREEVERELPHRNRYLPTPKVGEGSLGKRMRNSSDGRSGCFRLPSGPGTGRAMSGPWGSRLYDR